MGAHLITSGVVGHNPLRVLPRVGASALTLNAIRCGECNRPLSGWSCWYPDGEDELVPLCARCAGLGDARTSLARPA